jgi:hypothetical protein
VAVSRGVHPKVGVLAVFVDSLGQAMAGAIVGVGSPDHIIASSRIEGYQSFGLLEHPVYPGVPAMQSMAKLNRAEQIASSSLECNRGVHSSWLTWQNAARRVRLVYFGPLQHQDSWYQ